MTVTQHSQRPARMDPACPNSDFPIHIGGKWTGMIVVLLVDGPRRFTDLREMLSTVTPKVLTETLRSMQRDGLVLRREFDANPPHVEYELTPLGSTLMELIDASQAWGRAHMEELARARRDYVE